MGENSIRVDIDDLKQKISDAEEDGYVTVELSIESDGYCMELGFRAIGLDGEEPMDYGRISECTDEI